MILTGFVLPKQPTSPPSIGLKLLGESVRFGSKRVGSLGLLGYYSAIGCNGYVVTLVEEVA